MRLFFSFFIRVLLSGAAAGFFPAAAQSSDTLQVMFYNLTNYGNLTTECPASLNGPAVKNPDFRTIMQYVRPDILGVCEMNTNPALGNGFLSNVLNTDGVTHYRRSAHQVEPAGTLTCVLYYNGEKMVLHRQFTIPMSTRLTHHYRLYMRTASLAQGDTIWLNVLACHLKAGNTTADASVRASMTTAMRNYLQNFGPAENCLLMGDFNVYSSSEAAFQTLVSPGSRPVYQFLDPLNRLGSWSTNASFAAVHTQCPRTDNNGGCYSGGGLDDRFDFILMNRHALYDSAGLRYVPESYRVPGNDGLHFNKSITSSPANNSAPAAVIQALFRASDHLPVVARLRVRDPLVNGMAGVSGRPALRLWFDGDAVSVSGALPDEELSWSCFDFSGRLLQEGRCRAEGSLARIPLKAVSGSGPLRMRVSGSRTGYGLLTLPAR